MIAVDTNILVYAHRADNPWNHAAYDCMRELAEGRTSWAIPWPCVSEFFSVVTHPKIYGPPSSTVQAIGQLEAWFDAPGLTLLAEAGEYWPSLKQQLVAGKVSGPLVQDARIAALCVAHGVSELWTADRDFGRFVELRTRNPLVQVG